MRRALLAFVFLWACDGTETGNPPRASIGVGADSAGFAIGIVTPEESAAEVARIEGGESCDSRAVLAEDLTLELVPPASAPSLDLPTDVCAYRLVLAPRGDAPSFFLRGTRAPTGAPIVMESRSEIVIELVRREALDAGPYLLVLDLDGLFAGLPLEDLEPDDDGTIRVDAAHDPALAAELEVNLARSIALYRDLDGSGVLEVRQPLGAPVATPRE